MLQLQLTAVYQPAPEGGYTCTFEELPDVFSEGDTLEEAKANLADALELVMEYHRSEARRSLPEKDTVPETIELAAS